MLKVNQVKDYSYDEAHCGYGDSRKSINDATFNSYDPASTKLFQAHIYQVLRNSGVGARRFSGAHDLTQLHSANLAGMNPSGVVTAGGWSSPSKDFTTIKSEDGHAVLGFDFIDLIPADVEFLDGVRNGYALIEDENLWFINDEINDAAEENRPNQSDYAASERAVKPSLNIQSTNQNQDYASAYSAGFGSKDFRVSHVGILPHRGGSHV